MRPTPPPPSADLPAHTGPLAKDASRQLEGEGHEGHSHGRHDVHGHHHEPRPIEQLERGLPHAHAHEHGHGGHAHGAVAAGHSTALLAGIALNAGFVVVETVAGWRAGSMALMSDAAHNLGDVLALLLAWTGLWLAKRAPTPRFTWGWQRATVSAALFNAATLALLGLFLAWGAIGRLRAPTPIDAPMVMAVAAIGILINTATAWMLMRAGGDDLNMRGAFLHMVADAAVSAGVVLAAGATALTGALWIDAAVSLVISALITLGAWPVLKQALSLFMDGVPAGIDLDRVRAYLMALPGVGNVHDLHVWPLGTREAALSAHLVMPQGVGDDHFLLRARSELHDTFGVVHTTLQIETEQVAQLCTQDCSKV